MPGREKGNNRGRNSDRRENRDQGKDSDNRSSRGRGKFSGRDSDKRSSGEGEKKFRKDSDKKYSRGGDRKFGKDSDKTYSRDSGKKYGKDSGKKHGKFPGKDKDKPKFKDRLHVEDVRLNRFIANAGVCSRRDADELIKQGKIKVNGEVVTELGVKVKHTDRVQYNGKLLVPEKFQYVLLNKPKDFITTMDDPDNRKTVMSLVSKACPERIFPVGRLDRHTTGLLLFTNDGELAKKLTHPSFRIKKIYQVELDKPIAKADFDAILEGVELDDGKAVVDELAQVGQGGQVLGIEIHIGKNRIVRRIFEHFGYKVVKLDRVMFGPLTKKDLSRGKWRHLNPKEIQHLKNSVKKS